MSETQVLRHSEWLRSETREEHAALEATAFNRALTERCLPLASYVGLLKALSVAYGVFEHAMRTVRDPSVEKVWDGSFTRAHQLEVDLDYLGRTDHPEPRKAVEAALDLGDRILRRTVEDPASLLGHAYVLTGASLGQWSLVPTLEQIFSLDFDGLRFMTGFGPDNRRRFDLFRAALDRLELDEDRRRRFREAAFEAYRSYLAILDGLYPLEGDGDLTAVSLNAEAGRHPIPNDPREIGAATAAGRVSWDELPYFEARYGERGRRFTRSDGAWLATLTSLDEPQMKQQIEWLTRVLAARGMPSFLMERHLRNLHASLVEALPERADRYAKLRDAADALRADRRAHVSDPRFVELADLLDGVAPADGRHLTGRLVVAAVVDEANGRSNAVDSLLSWLGDADRFGPAWSERVNDVVDVVRREVGSLNDGAEG